MADFPVLATVRSGADHLRSLQDGRTVFVDGQWVEDVTTHPAYRNSVASAAGLYDYQARPENIEAMTFDIGNGRRVNRCWQFPRGYQDLIERRQALVAWAEQTSGFMGRSPDHVASALAGMVMSIGVFEAYDPKRAAALRDYFNYVASNDLFVTYVINNVQGDRSKDFSDQASEDLVARVVDEDSAGITIRGAKLFATSAIMANEILVGAAQPLQPHEKDISLSCALPMNAPGLRILSRKSYEGHAVSVFDNPLSSRFDENDALIFFDDVKVPWERVFILRDPGMSGRQFAGTAAHVYQNYQAQIRLSVKLRFLLGLARGIAETIGTINFPVIREQLGRLAGQAGMIQSMVYGMEAAGRMQGPYFLPDKHLLYAAQVQAQELYPAFIQSIRELAGGALLMLPSSVEDFADPAIARIIGATQTSPAMNGTERVKLLKLVWDAVGSEFASRHVQYEMFYAGAQFVTRGRSFASYDWDGAKQRVRTVLDSYSSPG